MALNYANYGWLVLPLHHPCNYQHCSCGHDCASPAKHPIALLVPHGLHDATCDPDLIRQWWQRFPDANIGVRTGPESNLLVIDIDHDKSGFHSYARLEAQNDAFPLTRESATGGDGVHLLFSWPKDTVINNSAGKLGAGIDIRGRNGYIVAPPSVHISGKSYQWAEGTRKIQPPPAWLVELLTKPTEPPPPAPRRRRAPLPFQGRPQPGQHYVEQAVNRECAQLVQVPAGQRHVELTKSASRIGTLLHLIGDTEADQVRDTLVEAGLVMGLPETEARKIVDDQFAWGRQHPRNPT